MQWMFVTGQLFLLAILAYASWRLWREKKKNINLCAAVDTLYSTCMGFHRLFTEYSAKFEESRKALDYASKNVDELNSLKMVFDELQAKHQEMATANHHNAAAAKKYAKVVTDASKVLEAVKKLNPGLFEKALEEVRRQEQIEKSLRAKEKDIEIAKNRKKLFVVRTEDLPNGESSDPEQGLDPKPVS